MVGREWPQVKAEAVEIHSTGPGQTLNRCCMIFTTDLLPQLEHCRTNLMQHTKKLMIYLHDGYAFSASPW